MDISCLADGVYDLTIDATDGSHSCRHTRPLIVKNGRSEPLAAGRAPSGSAAQPARLKFQVSPNAPDDTEVRLNGCPLARGAASKGPSRQWSFDVPSDRLQRLNRITIVPGPKGSPEVSRLRIERDGRSFGDVRFSPAMKRGTAKSRAMNGVIEYYIDLTYRGPRGAP